MWDDDDEEREEEYENEDEYDPVIVWGIDGSGERDNEDEWDYFLEEFDDLDRGSDDQEYINQNEEDEAENEASAEELQKIDDFVEILSAMGMAIDGALASNFLIAKDRRALEKLKQVIDTIQALHAADGIVSADHVKDALAAGLSAFLSTASDFLVTALITTMTTSAGALEPTPFGELVGAALGVLTAQVLTNIEIVGVDKEAAIEVLSEFLANAILEGYASSQEAARELDALIEEISYIVGETKDDLINSIRLISGIEEFTNILENDDYYQETGNPTNAISNLFNTLSTSNSWNGVNNNWNGGDKEVYPIVIDLDGDGIELVSLEESRMRLNLDDDAALERLGWAHSDDGVLLYDYNEDGVFSGISEVAFAELAGEGATDLEGLATLDADGDGYLTSLDFVNSEMSWESFLVWQDKNNDGKSTADEMMTLAELGIEAFALESDQISEQLNGNTVHGRFEILHTDGTISEGGDVAFMGHTTAIGSNVFGTDGRIVYNDFGVSLVFSSSEDDTFTDNSHDNMFVIESGDGHDTLNNYGGTNTIVFDGFYSDQLFLARSDNDLVISTWSGDESFTVSDYFNFDNAGISIAVEDAVIDEIDLLHLIEKFDRFDVDEDGFADSDAITSHDFIDAITESQNIWHEEPVYI